jgi:hypothetical protein
MMKIALHRIAISVLNVRDCKFWEKGSKNYKVHILVAPRARALRASLHSRVAEKCERYLLYNQMYIVHPYSELMRCFFFRNVI